MLQPLFGKHGFKNSNVLAIPISYKAKDNDHAYHSDGRLTQTKQKMVFIAIFWQSWKVICEVSEMRFFSLRALK